MGQPREMTPEEHHRWRSSHTVEAIVEHMEENRMTSISLDELKALVSNLRKK